MRDLYLKFADEAAWLAVAPAGTGLAVDVIGRCWREVTPAVVDAEGVETLAAVIELVSGWFVNIRVMDSRDLAVVLQAAELVADPPRRWADAPPPVPQVVTRRQMRMALQGAGLLVAIEAFVASASVHPLARIAWQDANDFYRSDAMLNALAPAVGLTPANLDDLFRAAATIP